MMAWQFIENDPNPHFQRSLGALEYKFTLDGRFNGTADLFTRLTIQKSASADWFTQKRLNTAWFTCRAAAPMLAVRIKQGPEISRSDVSFTLAKEWIMQDEVKIIHGDPEDLVLRLLGPKRDLDNAHQSKCFAVFSADKIDLFFLLSHCIGDGISSILVAKAFCDALATGTAAPSLSNEALTKKLEQVPSLDDLIRNQLGSK